MKLKILIAAMLVAVCAHAQNLSSVTASNIVDATNTKIPSGTLCFIGTDANDNPIGYQIGGGGQVVLTPACTPITNGAISGFSVANPALTAPANIAYRITVSDSHTLVRTDRLVQFTGSPFNYDTYVPPVGTITLGVSVPVLSVGNITVSGTCTGCATGSGITSLNTLAGVTQTFAVGTSGSNFNINSTGTVHNFNLPNASTSNRGALTSSDWNLFNGKQAAIAGNNCAARTFGNGINTAGTLLCGQPNSTQLADFSATAPSTAGKIPIYDPAATNSAGGTGAYVPGDPLVQGLVADGSTTAENPVAGGGYDTAGTPVLHRNTLLNGAPAGSEYGLVTRNIPSGTQPVSGTVTTTPPANASTNVAQVNGVATSTGSGVMGTGVQRVAVASDNDPVTVKQATGTNLHAVIDSGSTTAVTQATGTNLHAVIDTGSTTAVTQATGSNLHTVVDSGTATANQGTAAASTAGWPVTGGTIPESTAAWTSATSLNTTLRLTVTGYSSVMVFLNQGTTLTGGVVTFEASDTTAFTNAYSVNCVQSNSSLFGSTYTLAQSTNQALDCDVSGAAAFQVRLSTAITGSGTVNAGIMTSAMPTVPEVAVGGTVTANAGTGQFNVTCTAANCATNVAQVAGTNADTNSGTKSAGTLRVVLATDQPALTNKLLVTPDSVALPANQSVNVAQVNGVATSTGTGVMGTGVQRVAIASDNDPVTVKQATAANLNATVVGTGTFVTQSTLAAETTKVVGTVRVVGNVGGVLDVANNSAAPANLAAIGFETATQGTTQPTKSTAGNMRFGLARTDGAIYVAPHGPVIWSCGLSAIGTTLTQCQAAPAAGLSLYITDVVAQSNTTTSGLFTLRFGTGSNCGTGTGNIFFASASALIAAPASTSPVNDFHFTVPIQVTAANALCVLGVATNTTNIQINGYTAP